MACQFGMPEDCPSFDSSILEAEMPVQTQQLSDVKRAEEPIQLRQRALDGIRALILAPTKGRLRNSALKNLPDGALTSERAIAEELQISRTPVREALAVLEQLGIVEQTPQVGVQVRQISLQEATNVLRIREGMEGAAVERIEASGESKRRALEELESSIANMTERRSDVHAFMEADTDFHCSIVRLAGFSSHMGIMQSLRDLIHLHRLQHVLPTKDETEAIIAEHSQIVLALSSTGKAVTAVDQHLVNTLERLSRLSRSVDLVNAMHAAGSLTVGNTETLAQASPQTQKVAAAAAKY
jgi:DNA-binding GntR family transcriptional regulator